MKQFYFTRSRNCTVIYVPPDTALAEARAMLEDAERLFGKPVHVASKMPELDLDPLDDEVEQPRQRYTPGTPTINPEGAE